MEKEKIMIGDRLKFLLNENGLSIDKDILEINHNFTRPNLLKYLNNVRRPTLEDIVRLSSIFNTSTDYLLQNTDYVLDTWDYEFLNELEQYNSDKIKDFFKNRGNYTFLNDNPKYDILFALIYSSINEGKTLEDFEGKEKKEFINKIDLIAQTCLNLIDMATKPNYDEREIKTLNENIELFKENDYRFTDEKLLDQLEDNASLSNSDKKLLVKSYLNTNIANTQKALKLLEELEE